MQYAIIINEPREDFAKRSNAEAPSYWAAWQAYSKALSDAGVIRGGNALQGPDTATVVRLVDGKRLVQDGPFADTKEQLGGFMIIEVKDLDEALHWAALCPAAATGAVELRPVLPMNDR